MVYLFQGPDDDLRTSDDDIRLAVEQLLEARRALASDAQYHALHVQILANRGRSIFRALMRPLAAALGAELRYDTYCDRPVEEVRRMAAATLRCGLPLPTILAEILGDELEHLNAGYVGPLLQPVPGKRGALPHVLTRMKLKVLMWIEYQRGGGARLFEANAKVAIAINKSGEAIQHWRKELAQVYGDDVVSSLLRHSRYIGRLEKEPIAAGVVCPTEVALYLEAADTLEKDLAALAADFRDVASARSSGDRDDIECN